MLTLWQSIEGFSGDDWTERTICSATIATTNIISVCPLGPYCMPQTLHVIRVCACWAPPQAVITQQWCLSVCWFVCSSVARMSHLFPPPWKIHHPVKFMAAAGAYSWCSWTHHACFRWSMRRHWPVNACVLSWTQLLLTAYLFLYSSLFTI